MNIVTGVRTEVGIEGREILWQFHDFMMHSNKPYEMKLSTFQKKHFQKLCAASQLVCTCAFRRVVAT